MMKLNLSDIIQMSDIIDLLSLSVTLYLGYKANSIAKNMNDFQRSIIDKSKIPHPEVVKVETSKSDPLKFSSEKHARLAYGHQVEDLSLQDQVYVKELDREKPSDNLLIQQCLDHKGGTAYFTKRFQKHCILLNNISSPNNFFIDYYNTAITFRNQGKTIKKIHINNVNVKFTNGYVKEYREVANNYLRYNLTNSNELTLIFCEAVTDINNSICTNNAANYSVIPCEKQDLLIEIIDQSIFAYESLTFKFTCVTQDDEAYELDIIIQLIDSQMDADTRLIRQIKKV